MNRVHVTDISLVSTAADGAEGNRNSFLPDFSPDDRQIAFQSNATNLVPDGTSGVSHAYIKDRSSGAVTLVDQAADGTEGNGDTFDPFFSPDGHEVAFVSFASNLGPQGLNGRESQVVLKDLASGTVGLVSAAANGTAGDGSSFLPDFSPDGHAIAFTGFASNLVAGDANNASDIFLKDLASGAIARVSVAADGTEANDSSSDATFSPDGTRITFVSSASNLVPDDTNGVADVFVKDLLSGTVTLVSAAADGSEANGSSLFGDPVFSPDGRTVAFRSNASNLVAGDTNGVADIFIKDLRTGEVVRVSTSADGGQANGLSNHPVFSPDGRAIAFESVASNLVEADTNGLQDVFAKNLKTGDVTLVSATPDGTPANAASNAATFSHQGNELAFASFASNLVPGDTNGASDVFLATLQRVHEMPLVGSEDDDHFHFPAAFHADTVAMSVQDGVDELIARAVGDLDEHHAGSLAGHSMDGIGATPSGHVGDDGTTHVDTIVGHLGHPDFAFS
jgi:Tol biopolymer transport system component